MIRNDAKHWGAVTRSLHWLMALMIAAQVPLGFQMVKAYDAWLAGHGDTALVMALSRAHNTNGLLILILVVLRLSWRLQNPTPDLPRGLAAYQRFTARVTHVVLYGLLIVMPLSGWAALSAYDGKFPIFFFGWDNVFRIVRQVKKGAPFDSDFFTNIHVTCWKIGAFVLTLHIVGALWHQFVMKDGVLKRMWSGS
jgi:cytochrome b561